MGMTWVTSVCVCVLRREPLSWRTWLNMEMAGFACRVVDPELNCSV